MKNILTQTVIVAITVSNIMGCSNDNSDSQKINEIKTNTARAKASSIATVIKLYNLDMGLEAPRDDFGLEILLLSADDGGGLHGPYLERADDLIDPWGIPYELIVPGNINASFDVISWGADGEPGGNGFDKDITQ